MGVDGLVRSTLGSPFGGAGRLHAVTERGKEAWYTLSVSFADSSPKGRAKAPAGAGSHPHKSQFAARFSGERAKRLSRANPYSAQPPCRRRQGGCRLSRKPRRVRCVSSEKNPNHFLPGRVPGRKYISGCKCGICSPMANKLCAQQTAKTGGKARRGFSTSSTLPVFREGLLLSLNLPPWRRQ